MALSTGFRFPLAGGLLTEIAGDSDGFHVEANFNYYNPEFNAYHIGEDWNADTGGNTDLGLPVYAISNGTVVERGVNDAFGNYLIIRHDLPVPITVNGITTSSVYSFYGHFQSTAIVSVGQVVTMGQQIGNMGYTGMADGNAHVHLEIRLGYGVGYENMDGYSFDRSPTGWVDPTDFINAYRTLTADTAGNTLADARAITLGSTTSIFSEYVGPNDTSDTFVFATAGATNFALGLTGMTADADVYLLNAQGAEVAHSYNFGTAAEAININGLAAGIYYVQVRPYNGASTNYDLSLSATAIDNVTPMLISSTPADNASAVALNSNLVLTFNETVVAGSGNIVLYNANGTVARTIASTDTSQVSFSGSTLTINPTSDLADISDYHVNIAAGAIRDLAGNSFAGISGDTAFNFTTIAPDAGNSMAAAKVVTLGSSPLSFSEYVGPTDAYDYYRFTTTGATSFALGMTGLTGDADVYLLNSSGVEVAHSYNFGTTAEAININSLAAGTYYVQVRPYNGASANYNLSLAATAVDATAPLLSSATPVDNANTVAVDSNLVLSFNEAVTAGSGNIMLYNANGTLARSIAVTDTSQVGFSGNTVTINPTGDLTGNSSYYVNVAAGAIRDLAGNSYAGISGSTALNFTTVNPPDLAGNTMATARVVTVGSTHTVIGDYVGPTDVDDYFRFSATSPTNFSLALNGLSADADVYLFNSKGIEVAHSYNTGTTAEAIHIASLAPGTYYVEVHAYQSASTHYALDMFGIPA